MPRYSIGLDFGTNSVRALIVDVATGEEVATSVHDYRRGDAGIILDDHDPNLARQHPRDYVEGTEACVRAALEQAAGHRDFSTEGVIGIGVDTTGSTPIPVDADGVPLALQPEFENDPDALAWLWKDHTGHAEAEEITEAARHKRPQYLDICGGVYSSEWYWSKALHCARTNRNVFEAAHTWVEAADWIPAFLTGTTHPDRLTRCICAAGHKAMFDPEWDGYPDAEFLNGLDSGLARLRDTLPDVAANVSQAAGPLTEEWADRLGLPAGIPVAVGAFDAHLGAVGSGIEPGALVKIIGTSCCDMMVAPLSQNVCGIPGLCGIVPESILPGCHGLEAGQSAVGDIFNWFVNSIQPGGVEKGSHEALTQGARALAPGASGLLGLDWHNGNRTVLVDQRLTGGLIGMTLRTTPAEIYRALIESTAFGARAIIERFEHFDVQVQRVINCGGIAVKNPLVMQIYADVLGRKMEISRSDQTCALGAAMAGAVVAGAKAGGHTDFTAAARAMTAVRDTVYHPGRSASRVYDQIFPLYMRLHDAFGLSECSDDLFDIMKELLRIRDATRR